MKCPQCGYEPPLRNRQERYAATVAALARIEDVPLGLLDLPTRLRTAFRFGVGGIRCETVGDVLAVGEYELLHRTRNVGARSVEAWRDCLATLRADFAAAHGDKPGSSLTGANHPTIDRPLLPPA
jgi:hypothetical protein